MEVKTACFCSDFILHICFVTCLLSYDAYIPWQLEGKSMGMLDINEGCQMN
jgi:hypothetical protein